jgi:hypothetical protein
LIAGTFSFTKNFYLAETTQFALIATSPSARPLAVIRPDYAIITSIKYSMAIITKTRDYYFSNLKILKTYLENIDFLDTNETYPNSVVITFGLKKIIGEISIWENDIESYLELEYANLSELDLEPIIKVIPISNENIIEILSQQFEDLRKSSIRTTANTRLSAIAELIVNLNLLFTKNSYLAERTQFALVGNARLARERCRTAESCCFLRFFSHFIFLGLPLFKCKNCGFSGRKKISEILNVYWFAPGSFLFLEF